MSDFEEIEHEVLRTWGGRSLAHSLLTMFVDRLRPEIHRHLTLVGLRRLCGEEARLADIYQVAEYFASETLMLLERRFELFADDVARDISLEDIHEASRTGVLHDPETGESVPDWEQFVVPYYVPTSKLEELVRERQRPG